jgi:enterobactin synthetase component D
MIYISGDARHTAFWRACGGLLASANADAASAAATPLLSVCEHDLATSSAISSDTSSAALHARIAIPPGFGPKRAAEFVSGRAAALSALTPLCGDSASIGRGLAGEPLWPSGVTGSISHSHGHAVAAVTAAHCAAALGVDIEMRRCLSERARAWVCTAAELQQLAALPPAQQALYALILFSAKESIYKCLYHAQGLRARFADATVVLAGDWAASADAPAMGTITLTRLGGVAAGIACQRLTGCFGVFERHVTTCVVLSRRDDVAADAPAATSLVTMGP